MKYSRTCKRRYFLMYVFLCRYMCELTRTRAHFKEPLIQGDTKKRELLKNPTKIEEIQEKKIIDRN